LQVFPELLQPSALEGFHSFLPQNVELIGNSHVLAMEKPDLIVAGFPCQGFSRASGRARGLADPRTHLLTEALRVIHLIHRRRGHGGWLIENVDATDHPIDSVRLGTLTRSSSVYWEKGWLTMRFRWALMPTGIGGIGRT
jgi:hypothetical protein